MKVVLDTNIIVSFYITPHSTTGAIEKAWRSKQFKIIISPAVLDEYIKALAYPHIKSRHTLDLVKTKKLFQRLATVVYPKDRINVIVDDPDDNKLLECAIEGHADCIVSGDPHLLKLKKYNHIRIISPRLFVSLLEK